MMGIVALLGNRWALIGLMVVAVGLALLWFYYDAKAAGAAAAIAVATAEALRRTNKANAAKSEIKPNDQDAMRNDSFNRDNTRR